MESEPRERLLRPSDVAAYLGIPKATLYSWRYRGEGPPGLRIGRHLRYRSGDIDDWVRQQLQKERTDCDTR
jgi:excisionase family DNA binding protein